MAGLVPAIHVCFVFGATQKEKHVDGRDKPSHDE